MKNKFIIIGIFILLIIIISSVIYYCKLYDKKLVDPEDILTDSKFQNITYNETSNSDDLKDDVLGIIKIEKIRFKSRDKRRL